MSGLHEKFDEIVADVPVYGDLDRAIEQAERDRRHRYGAVAGLAAAAAVVVLIVGMLAVTRDGSDSHQPAPPVTTPTPTTTKSQSPQTWVDTAVPATNGYEWDVADPLKVARDAWFAVVAEHLDPKGEHLELDDESGPGGVRFGWPGEGSEYSTGGELGLMIDRGDLNLLDDGCGYLRAQHPAGYPDDEVSCRTEGFTRPSGERAQISTWESGSSCCGDYFVAVAVERHDGLIGYVVVDGRGTPDNNPVTRAAMAAAAADPRLTLPETAYAVPASQAVMSVVEDHFPGYRYWDEASWDHPGLSSAVGRLGRLGLRVQVWPAGGTPACGRSSLTDCVERRVFGADDPTTVFVGAWDVDYGASCCPTNSRATSRVFVYVGPRHTVVVRESLWVREDEGPVSADLDQRLIDLALDPRLQ